MVGDKFKECSICGKKEHHAKGLCNSCYSKNLSVITKHKCQICGSSNYHAKGLCKSCYAKEITGPKAIAERKKHREENPIIEQKDLICISCGKKGCSAKNKCKKCYMKEHSTKTTQQENRKRWREFHQEDEKERKRKSHVENRPERLKQSSEYYYKNKDVLIKKQYEYKKRRLKIDPKFKLGENLRSLIREGLKRRDCTKSCKTTELLGATIPEVLKHLESQFTDGMTWDNHGKDGWETDHITPLKAFDLSNVEHQKIAFNYKNLQPLWWRDNNKKSGLIPMGYDK